MWQKGTKKREKVTKNKRRPTNSSYRPLAALRLINIVGAACLQNEMAPDELNDPKRLKFKAPLLLLKISHRHFEKIVRRPNLVHKNNFTQWCAGAATLRQRERERERLSDCECVSKREKEREKHILGSRLVSNSHLGLLAKDFLAESSAEILQNICGNVQKFAKARQERVESLPEILPERNFSAMTPSPRAEYGLGEYGFNRRAQWFFGPSPSSGERNSASSSHPI